jgi:hypothetical protein
MFRSDLAFQGELVSIHIFVQTPYPRA